MTGVSTAQPRRLTTLIAALAAGVWLSAGTVHAQSAGNPTLPAPAGSFVGDAHPSFEVAASTDIQQSIQRLSQSERAAQLLQQGAPGVQPAQAKRERSGWRRFAGGAVGAFGGFFAGGYIGATIDGGCGGCDDPGLKGALIGMPIGAVLGGIAGALWLF